MIDDIETCYIASNSHKVDFALFVLWSNLVSYVRQRPHGPHSEVYDIKLGINCQTEHMDISDRL